MTSSTPTDGSSGPDHRPVVLLYSPRAVFFTMPLGLVAIGSHLDAERYRVVIVDGRFEDDPLATLAEHLDHCVCLGVSVLTGDPLRDALHVSRWAKQQRPDVPVVWGGWHPSLFAAECLDEPSIDIAVAGQGEVAFVDIVGRLAAGESLAGCHGCAHRGEDGAVVVEPPRLMVPLDQLAEHNYDFLEVERYFVGKERRQLDYISSQGCPFRCAFCADPFVFQRKWYGLDPERMAEEIEALWHRYRFDDLSFQDETFFVYAKRVAAVAQAFVDRQLDFTWAATLRADQCMRLSDEIFELCKRSGLRRVLVGVESGSQAMLERIQKDTEIDQVLFTAERCRQHDIAAIFPFIVGFPDETPEQVDASLELALRLRAMSPAFETPIFYFKPYPGTSLTHAAVADGFELPSTLEAWADFDFIGSAGPWVSPELYRRVERFKFYQRVGWSTSRPWVRPIQQLARWRCRNDRFALPVEKALSDWLWPQPALS